ncbi:response regulator transcription factor [Pseudonocardia xinjiangensis]
MRVAAVAGVTEPATGRAGPVRVLVVDDDPLVRSALHTMLGGTPLVEIVGQAADGTHVPAAVAAHDPQVVLMDIRMPVVDGLAATAALRARPDAPEVIILTTFDTDDHVLRALRAGAAGFVLKDTPPARILDAILRVADGETMLSPSVLRQLVDHVTTGEGARRHRAAERLDRLTTREREVATRIGEGLTNAEIAASLHMSVATVKAHITRILTALGLNNRVQIALLAHDAAPGGDSPTTGRTRNPR